MMIMDDYNTQQKAEFNMAVSYLNRLNGLFSQCDQASMSLDIYSWFHSILALYRELSTWMKAEKGKDPKTDFNDRINKVNPQIAHVFQKMESSGKIEIPHDLYMELHEMELTLRQVADKAGLMMKMADDAFDALR